MMFAATARGVRGLSGLHVLRLRVNLVSFVVLVMVPHPGHGVLEPFFIAPFWGDVQPIVRSDEDVQPASVARIGVEDIARGAFVKHTRAGPFLAWELLHAIVVIDFSFPQLFLLHRDLVVVVEVAAVRRYPM